MVNQRQTYGRESESIAVKQLKKQGYKIVEQNYRSKLGEIDIIAKDKKTLVFVEVKARRSDRYGSPKWAITPKKKRQMSKVALYYLKVTKQTNVKARFDVVTIRSLENKPQIDIIKNAFELAYG
jgi:putative endonuclease